MRKISVIIPCYNSVKYLPECLTSLENQTIGISELEIILVNDASKDHTWEMILEFEQKYPENVIAIDMPENRRQGGARNEGIRYATGEYIAFLDSDDIALPHAYKTAYTYAVQNDADIVQFNHYNFLGNQMELCDNCQFEGILDLTNKEIHKMLLAMDVVTLGCWNKLYRREMVCESGAWYSEHRIYEEPSFVFPQLLFAKRMCCIKDALYKIRLHAESTMHSEVRKTGRILDCPEVQMDLIRYLVAHRELMEEYYEEIEFRFLRSYYMEPLYFAGTGNLFLDVSYFKKMQKTVRSLFPEWRCNRYLQDEKIAWVAEVIATCEKEMSQDELDAYCKELAKK